MLTKRAHFIVIFIRINRFYLPLFIPAFLLNSLVAELCDLVNFFTFFIPKITFYVNLTEDTVYSLCDFKKYDFVDVDVTSKEENERVKIKICTR